MNLINLDGAIIVALGANLPGPSGAPIETLTSAVASLPTEGLPVIAVSGWWRSAAWPDSRDPDYINGVALVEATLPPHAALTALQRIEARHGRTRAGANAPRTLDLDLIAHGRTILHAPDLVLPHPRAAERLFVMGPLAEIAPLWRHPVHGRTATELAAAAVVGADSTPLAPPGATGQG